MRIVLNGEERDVPESLSVTALLDHLHIPSQGVVVERNGEVLHRDGHANLRLAQGDRLEIVRFVGGG